MFVRTKDNRIIEVENEKHLCSDNECRFQYKGSPALIRESNVVKSSENLEDLCDEFIWKWNKNEFPYSTARQYVRYIGMGDLKRAMRSQSDYGYYLNRNYEIYGAIWTDKGLLYVARMNDKGEWELL